MLQRYQPQASDPNLSGALASVLWELNLLSKHYHPAISTMASSILTMNTAHNQVYHTSLSPPQAFKEFSLQRESFKLKMDFQKSNNKRKRGSDSAALDGVTVVTETPSSVYENQVREKLAKHFMLLRDIKENERLRRKLDGAMLSLNLYEEYKKQKKAGKSKTKKTKKKLL